MDRVLEVLRRYQPFIWTVTAIAVLALVLPPVSRHVGTSTSSGITAGAPEAAAPDEGAASDPGEWLVPAAS